MLSFVLSLFIEWGCILFHWLFTFLYLCDLSLYVLTLFPISFCEFFLFCKSTLYFIGDKYYVNISKYWPILAYLKLINSLNCAVFIWCASGFYFLINEMSKWDSVSISAIFPKAHGENCAFWSSQTQVPGHLYKICKSSKDLCSSYWEG